MNRRRQRRARTGVPKVLTKDGISFRKGMMEYIVRHRESWAGSAKVLQVRAAASN
jgi:hypothetical protein